MRRRREPAGAGPPGMPLANPWGNGFSHGTTLIDVLLTHPQEGFQRIPQLRPRSGRHETGSTRKSGITGSHAVLTAPGTPAAGRSPESVRYDESFRNCQKKSGIVFPLPGTYFAASSRICPVSINSFRATALLWSSSRAENIKVTFRSFFIIPRNC